MKPRKAPMTLVLEQNWRFDTRASVAEAQEQLRKSQEKSLPDSKTRAA